MQGLDYRLIYSTLKQIPSNFIGKIAVFLSQKKKIGQLPIFL